MFRHQKSLAIGVVVACLAAYGFLQTPYGASTRAAIVNVGQYLAKVLLVLEERDKSAFRSCHHPCANSARPRACAADIASGSAY